MNIDNLLHLTKAYTGEIDIKYQILPQSGSARKYVRIFLRNGTIMGVYNSDINENRAFFKISAVFKSNNLSVPDILSIDSSEQYYLVSDHGNVLLFDIINNRAQNDLTPESYKLVERSLHCLIEFQLCGLQQNFYENCNNPKSFDKRSVMWDLNYFKYNFLKPAKIDFDEWQLENDFEIFAKKITNIPLQGFMYRDFQSRNILIENNNPVFIDFQGGRKGPLQYDVISLLWQAKINLTENDRYNLLNSYLNVFETKFQYKREEFMADFDIVMLLRFLQVLGAYGFRGLYERKSHFLGSIYQGIKQLTEHWQKSDLKNNYLEINNCIFKLSKLAEILSPQKSERFVIKLSSFSFINGSYPIDLSAHGGGYVFDCRALPNPGRIDHLKHLTGKDHLVAEYLKNSKEVTEFVNSCFEIVLKHIKVFEERGFSCLNVSFGCTGGQHRSVFSAETVSRLLTQKGYTVVLSHRELNLSSFLTNKL